MNIGYARNETVELIIGNAFIAIGGFFAGFRVDLQGVQINPVIAAILIIIGVIFDLRVLRKFDRELQLTKKELKDAEKTLKETKEKTFGLSLFSDSSWANPLQARVKSIEKQLEDIKNKIKRIEFRLNSL